MKEIGKEQSIYEPTPQLSYSPILIQSILLDLPHRSIAQLSVQVLDRDTRRPRLTHTCGSSEGVALCLA